MPERPRIPGDTPITRHIAKGLRAGRPKDEILLEAVELVVARLKDGLKTPVWNQAINKVAKYGAERRLNDKELLAKLLDENVNDQ